MIFKLDTPAGARIREVTINATHAADVDAWRSVARDLLREHVRPEAITWRLSSDVQENLLSESHVFETRATTPSANGDPRVSREFMRMATSVACHSNSARWDALYRALFRLTHGEPALLDVATDPDVHRLFVMDKAVRRDVHKMHAFVRFRAVSLLQAYPTPDDSARNDHAFVSETCSEEPRPEKQHNHTHYVAWFEPQHHILRHGTAFFARRFPSMRWSILTPAQCVHWDGSVLQFTPGVSRANAPQSDELEDLWRSYYAHIFNPARVAVGTMQAEMPRRYWKNLPEAGLISQLTREAPARVLTMLRQLDEAPADMPDDMRSLVGDASEPERRQSPSSRDETEDRLLVDLETPSAWDPVHDPGVRVARERLQCEREVRESAVSASNPAASEIDQRADNRRRVLQSGAREPLSNAPDQRKTENIQRVLQSPSVVKIDDAIVRVGTASWTDPTILRRGVFYPDDVTTPEARLNYYASQFSLVEVDSTYYVPPTRAMAAAWAERTPDSFVFDVKAFALMTGHAAEIKRMPDWLRRLLPKSMMSNERVYTKELPTPAVDEVWQRFQHALAPLRDAGKLGPILLQYPRWFAPSRESADALRVARERMGDSAAAVEFRNPEWVSGRITARTLSLLESLNLTYVNVDAPPDTGSSMPPTSFVTTPELSVVRLHGRRTAAWEAKHTVVSERYRYLYDSEQLADLTARIGTIANRMRELKPGFPDMAKAKQGVHVVFNNCHANYGTSNAVEITAMLIEFDKIRRMR